MYSLVLSARGLEKGGLEIDQGAKTRTHKTRTFKTRMYKKPYAQNPYMYKNPY